MKIYDLLIVGAGAAGVMAARTAASGGMSVLLLEKGSGLASRRGLSAGWFGHGLYAFDRMEGEGRHARDVLALCQVANGGLLEHRKGRGSHPPEHRMRLLPCGYYRIPPAVALSLAESLYRELKPRIDIVFGCEIREIRRDGGCFTVTADHGSFAARRCILSTGSRSAEWLLAVCSSLGIACLKPPVLLGVRVEAPSRLLATLAAKHGDILAEYEDVRFDDARFGGFVAEREDAGMLSAFGYTLPDRQSSSTSFMAGFAARNGFGEAMRTTRIVNVLSNDKVRRERVHDFLQGRSVLRHLPQFECLMGAFIEFDRLVPKFAMTAGMHVPETRIGGTLPADENMRTALPGLYGAGQCVAGIRTLLEAMSSGMTAAQSAMEDKDNE